MKIRYEFVTGEVVEIEVSEGFAELSATIDKEIFNSDRKETRRHNSIDGMHEAGVQLADPTADMAATTEEVNRNEKLYNAINQLLPRQKDLVWKVYFEEMSLVEIARDENVTEAAIRNRLKKIYKKLEKSMS